MRSLDVHAVEKVAISITLQSPIPMHVASKPARILTVRLEVGVFTPDLTCRKHYSSTCFWPSFMPPGTLF